MTVDEINKAKAAFYAATGKEPSVIYLGFRDVGRVLKELRVASLNVDPYAEGCEPFNLLGMVCYTVYTPHHLGFGVTF